MTKNISVIECLSVFSTVAACACIESHVAAARAISPERRRADLIATVVRAQGGASPAEFARSMSRRQISQWREFSLLPLTDRYSKTPPKCVRHSGTDPEAERCFVTSLSRKIGETSSSWIRGHSGDLSGLPLGQLADQPRAELVDATGLIAGLAFHQVRPGSRTAPCATQPGSPCAKLGRVLAGPPAAGSVFSLTSERLGAIASANSPEPMPAPMEILFAELAVRRLRSLVTRERP
jgi:hypothetical protein